MSAQTPADQSTARPNAVPEIPKSPPKWPLRPGVLVHVKCDTKQSLCANRAQSPFNASSMNTSSLNNVSYASPLLAGAATSTRNTSMASGNGGGITNNTNNNTSTPITLPELPARNAAKTSGSNNNCKDAEAVTDAVTTTTTATPKAKKAKSVARALLIDEDGITAKVESDDNSKEDESHIDMDETTAINDTTTTTTAGLLRENGATTPAPATAMAASQPSNGEPNNDELLRFTSSNLIERILGRLRWRREQSPNQNNAHTNNGNGVSGGGGGNGNAVNNNEDGILAKSNKRALSLLRATGWFGSGKSTNSTTGLMSDSNKSHLNGITCSDSGKYTPFFHTLSLSLSVSCLYTLTRLRRTISTISIISSFN